MGRHTSIYTFDKVKAANFLYPDLKYKALVTRTFHEFIEARIYEYPNSGIKAADDILQVVKSDINYISPDDLFEITAFLEEEVYKKFSSSEDNYYKLVSAEIDRIYNLYGIELLYEVHTSTVCYSYMFQYGNYEGVFPVNDLFDDEGHNISSSSFSDFNDYMILLMYRIISDPTFKQEYHELLKKHFDTVNAIQLKFKNNTLMLKIIEEELLYLKRCLNEGDEHHEIENNTIYWSQLFFEKSIEMNERIHGKDVRIVIVDSY